MKRNRRKHQYRPIESEPPRARYWPVFAAWAALFVITLVLNSHFEAAAENRIVYDQTHNLQPLAGAEATHTIFADPIELHARQNLQIEISAPVDNSWVWIGGDFINEATGAVIEFESPVEYYHGYEGGEHWTEGGKTSDLRISAPPKGRYTPRLEFQWEQFTTPITVNVRIRQGVPNGWHLFWTLLLISLIPLYLTIAWLKDFLPESRSTMNLLTMIQLSLGALLVALYAMTGYNGWEYFSSQNHQLPNEVRSSTGIRSYNFWHDGYQGGK